MRWKNCFHMGIFIHGKSLPPIYWAYGLHTLPYVQRLATFFVSWILNFKAFLFLCLWRRGEGILLYLIAYICRFLFASMWVLQKLVGCFFFYKLACFLFGKWLHCVLLTEREVERERDFIFKHQMWNESVVKCSHLINL